MTRFTPIIPGLTFVMSVAALVLAPWPVVTDAPWEDGVTSAESSEILQTQDELSSEEKEAERVAKCGTAMRLLNEVRRSDRAQAEVVSTVIENNCLSFP